MTEFIVYGFVFIFSYFGVTIFQRWSLRRNLFDIPNERSSHTVPTPRGGGVVIIIICLVAYIYLSAKGGNLNWGYLLGATMIVGVSWLDDLYSIPFGWRLCVHIGASVSVILSEGNFREFYIPIVQQITSSDTLGLVVTFFWIVWLTNAYNFMDGIDGIAGLQAVTAGIGWFSVGSLLGADSSGFYAGVIAFSSLGFTIQNWQPAKIFMGDVGSAFLGYTFASMPLLMSREIESASETRELLPLIAVSLTWMFVFDTVYTFISRLLKRERVWEAHRRHIYQGLNISGLSHQTVAIIYGVLSTVIACTTIMWVKWKGVWEFIWLFSISVQSVGLLIYSLSVRKRKQYIG